MNNSQKFFSGLVIGATAGVALALFLNSEKGKEMVIALKKATDKMDEDFSKKMDKFNENINDLCNNGLLLIDELEKKGKQQSA